MKYVPATVTRAVGRTVLKAQKNSPTLLFVGGIGGAVAATVLACRATLKAQPIVDNMEKDLIDVEVLQTRRQVESDEARQTKAHIMVKGAVDISKLYAPAVVVGVISITCLTKSHRQLTQRNAALTTAYVGLQSFLESYRGRVRQEIGEEREKNVYYATTPVELIDKDDSKGVKKIYGSRPNAKSPYSVIFDETSSVFQDANEYNLHFIKLKERMLTDKLRAQGHLFLNDVYKDFDLPETPTGQICGWIIPYEKSDDFVEITITPLHDFHGSLMLDFNVAGVVYELLDDEKMSR